MNRVRLLPEHVANQIAAGEVVERPASVVKELVENALDAQSARISIEVQAGGRSLIRVTDDGVGMSRDDALLCLERHATSKIQRAEDLHSISTMGFRGEALPSIASVSRFTLTTRERDSASPEGTQVVVNGGRIIEVKAAGCAPGTSVEVRQLFYNLPARRKFLRGEETERAHIQHYLTLAALAHPQVAFTFTHDTRTVWQLPAQKSGDGLAALRERLRALMGGVQLLEVDFTAELDVAGDESGFADSTLRTPHSAFRLWGLIGAPGVSRATRQDQNLFVNRRPVENRGLNHALLEGYHTALMKGRYPVCCLFLEMDPGEVDVNIHPAKREVKFHRERDVRRLVTRAIREALLNFHSRPAIPQPSPLKLAAQTPAPPAPEQRPLPMGFKPVKPAPVSNPSLGGFPGERVELVAPPPTVPAQSKAARLPSTPAVGTPHPASGHPLPSSDEGRGQGEGSRPAFAPGPGDARRSTSEIPTPLLAVPLRIVGVIGRLYVVLESDRGLVLMDQHAAHERILFEQMLQRLERNQSAPSQRLLLPETVELPPRDAQFVREHMAMLQRLGVGLAEFGERTFLLDGLPPFVRALDARRFVLELVDELKAAGQTVNTLRLGEHVVAKTVCRHAVKANDPLAGPELEKLLEDLRRCDMPYTCPHGRPTLIEMSLKELEKKFGRVQ